MSARRHDDLGVCVVCLAELLGPIVEQERLRNPRDLWGQSYGRESTGTVTILAQEAGVPPRRIYAILNHEGATVGLCVADDLLVAFDRPDLVHALDVFPREMGVRLGDPGFHTGCTRNGQPAAPIPAAHAEPDPYMPRVEVICPRCGEARTVTAEYARKKLTDDTVCRACSNRAINEVWAAERVRRNNLAAARRLAAVEPISSGEAPAAAAPLATTREREADAPALGRREAA